MIFFPLGCLRDKQMNLEKTIQIANLAARIRGQGAFTRLVSTLQESYSDHWLVVENANDRFSAHLRKVQWLEVEPGCVFILGPK
jgi:hypothetical protein